MEPQDILYPRSRFEVLRTLHYSPSAVSLREISYRSSVVLNSVQRAIKFLIKNKIISKKKIDHRVYYQISNSEVTQFMTGILERLEPFEIRAKASSLKDRSTVLIDQIEQRTRMIQHAKRSLKS